MSGFGFEQFEHLYGRGGDTCAGAEDGCDAGLVEEVIVLSGDYTAGGDHDVFAAELITLIVGCVVAFLVSIVVIKFLMSYIKRRDFKIFGWYRIVLGVVVIAYFLLK